MSNLFPLEAAIVIRIMRLLKDKGAWAIKTTGVSKVGCPDIVACYKGRFIAIEVKRPQIGVVTKKQWHEITAIQAASGYAIVADNVNAVREILNIIDNAT